MIKCEVPQYLNSTLLRVIDCTSSALIAHPAIDLRSTAPRGEISTWASACPSRVWVDPAVWREARRDESADAWSKDAAASDGAGRALVFLSTAELLSIDVAIIEAKTCLHQSICPLNCAGRVSGTQQLAA